MTDRVNTFNVEGVSGPFGPYSLGALTNSQSRLLFVAGQTGVDSEGRNVETITEQMDVIWNNIRLILLEQGCPVQNIVKMTGFYVHDEDLRYIRQANEAHLGAHRPASTLVKVAGLINKQWRIEIEVVAVA